ncbi:MAG TPA: hypothetical protein IAA29_03275 [Candidatus Paenibacillus intestinavium]|nr:hypothetical protein [Candidatus Paenibacillus intestinavium]
MTILISYKSEELTVFVSDFRVSFSKENQEDAMSKFLSFDNRLAFFTAGSVKMWQLVVPVIQQVMPRVNIDNICDEEDPLFVSLRSTTEQTTPTNDDPGVNFILKWRLLYYTLSLVLY